MMRRLDSRTRSGSNVIRLGCVAAIWAIVCADARAADPRIEVELFTQPGMVSTNLQQWSELFGELGADAVRIRGGRGGDRVEVEIGGTETRPVYRVRGALTGRNRVRLPGGEYSMSQAGAIGAWLSGLGKEAGGDGAENPWALPAEAAEATWRDLSKRIDTSTAGMSRGEALTVVQSLIAYPILIEVADEARLRVDLECQDELRGMSCGTALAMLLREVEYGFEPGMGRDVGLRYMVCRLDRCEAAWPVGWPPKENKRETLPKLFEVLTADVGAGVKLGAAVEAIGEKLEAPIFLDRMAIAAMEVDFDAEAAAMPRRRLTYSSLLGKLLGRARLKYELRVDERERPFLWVGSVRP